MRKVKPSNFLADIKGQLVRIEWRNPDDDWYFFTIQGYEAPLVLLKGEDDPITKCKHQGDSFYVNISEIRQIEVFRPDSFSDLEERKTNEPTH